MPTVKCRPYVYTIELIIVFPKAVSSKAEQKYNW